MAQTRIKAKSRRDGDFFVAIPMNVLDSPEYGKLSAWEVKLLLDLAAQYRWSKKRQAGNNGDLTTAWSVMSRRGWRSRDTLFRAKCGLLNKGWIVVARQGGRRIPTLYAVTFWAVDECNGKLDIAPTKKPPGTWRQCSEINSLTRLACQINTAGVSKQEGIYV